ncbi:MAG: LPS assembly lipoprotein LptE [Acetobacteraceae bacterium]|nr:LPS assembly lipoprotein LptE [Acetobacteraceae bacterium]
MTPSRRHLLRWSALLPLSSLLPVAGCGFQPVYMPTASGKAGPASRELAAIAVPVIPERQGQVLRQALQERFADDSGTTPLQYDLAVVFSVSNDSIAIQGDNLATRARVIGRASFTLMTRGNPPTRVTGGSARAVDAYNYIDEQFFAADMENTAVVKRVAEALADQITVQLAMYFRKRAAAG